MKNGEFIHTIESLKGSSHEYGKCEICNKHCTEVFILDEKKYYTIPDVICKQRKIAKGSLGITAYGCILSKFGHKECLEKMKKERIKLNKNNFSPQNMT